MWPGWGFFKTPCAQCYRMINLRHLKKGDIFGIFKIISSYFKPEKSPFWPFLIENWPKIHKIGDFSCKKIIII